MKKYTHLLILIVFLFITGSASACQLVLFPDTAEEKVVLFSDRSLYIAGELIQFSATIFNSNNPDAALKSRILYCELITPDGKVIANNKFMISKSVAVGCISIPVEVYTGTYYLKAYTKIMRQNGPQSYEYKQVRIVNPFRPDVLAVEADQGVVDQKFTQIQGKPFDDVLLLSVEKQTFSPRDTIRISYEQINGTKNIIKSISLSVVPENSKPLTLIQPALETISPVDTRFYTETRGLSLSGKLTEASSSVPIVDKRVNLSIIGEGRDFMAVRTDTLGRFFFALPDYYGSRDLFLCAEKTPSQVAKIWVDNDFCTTPFQLPAPVFTLTEQERNTARNMTQNMQISAHFQEDLLTNTITDSLKPTKKTNPFYGKPTNTIIIDKYIQLPTLEEYFNELPSQVKVRKRKGESYFAVQGSANISMYDPLVLVDWVAVDEPAKILAASPQNIARIEIVNEDYMKGGQIYGGIISFISKKGDFAGIDLPSAGLFVNYHFLSENHCIANVSNNDANKPDARNTVLWEPMLKVPKTESEKIILKAPDTPGKYSVVMEGITTDGDFFSITSGFEVKD